MKPNWRPLEEKLGIERYAGFMFMGRMNGVDLYKHGIARMYLTLDDHGYAYTFAGRICFKRADFDDELPRIERRLTEMGETLETAYDEEYIARRHEALRRAGFKVLRVQMVPDEYR